MRYVRGRDFDAVREIEDVVRPGMPRGRLEAHARLIELLAEIDEDGFRTVRREWTKTGVDDIWVYTDGPVRCAIQVTGGPGEDESGEDESGEDEQVTLLVTVFTEGHAELVIWLGDVIAIAGRRLNEGEIVE